LLAVSAAAKMMDIFLVIMGHFGNAISGLYRLTLVDEDQGLADAY